MAPDELTPGNWYVLPTHSGGWEYVEFLGEIGDGRLWFRSPRTKRGLTDRGDYEEWFVSDEEFRANGLPDPGHSIWPGWTWDW